MTPPVQVTEDLVELAANKNIRTLLLLACASPSLGPKPSRCVTLPPCKPPHPAGPSQYVGRFRGVDATNAAQVALLLQPAVRALEGARLAVELDVSMSRHADANGRHSRSSAVTVEHAVVLDMVCSPMHPGYLHGTWPVSNPSRKFLPKALQRQAACAGPALYGSGPKG